MVGAGRFERPTPCAQDIGCPHLGINRFNNLRTLLVWPCGNFSYNLDCKAAIRLVKPPTTPTGSPAGSADCEINQRGRAHVVAAGGCRVESRCGNRVAPCCPALPQHPRVVMVALVSGSIRREFTEAPRGCDPTVA